MEIKIKGIDSLIKIEGKLTKITIQNAKTFRTIYKEKENSITLYEGIKEINSKAKVTYVNNVLDININDKKYVNNLYEMIKGEIKSSEYIDKYNELVDLLNEMLAKIDLDYNIDYKNEINIDKLLQSMEVRYDDCKENLEMFVEGITIISKATKNKIFITFNIQNIFDEEEISKIEEMLKYKDFLIIDISYVDINRKMKTHFNIDENLCII